MAEEKKVVVTVPVEASRRKNDKLALNMEVLAAAVGTAQKFLATGGNEIVMPVYFEGKQFDVGLRVVAVDNLKFPTATKLAEKKKRKAKKPQETNAADAALETPVTDPQGPEDAVDLKKVLGSGKKEEKKMPPKEKETSPKPPPRAVPPEAKEPEKKEEAPPDEGGTEVANVVNE